MPGFEHELYTISSSNEDDLNYILKQNIAPKAASIFRATINQFNYVLRESGVQCLQFSMLALIYQNETCKMKELAELWGVDPTTVTRSIQALNKKGLVSLVTSPQDRRSKRPILTPEGRDLLDKYIPLYAQAYRTLIEKMGNEHYQDILRAYDLYFDALDQIVD